MPKAKTGLTAVIADLKFQNNKTLDTLSNIVERVENLENNNSATQKSLASMEMRMRDMEIKLRSEKGERNIDLSKKFGLSEGRICQIIKS